MTDPDAPIEFTMPPGSVVITPSQMYAELRIMGGKVDNLIAVIDPALSTIREDIGDVRNVIREEVKSSRLVHDDHETRLRSIERWRWAAAGAVTGAGAALAQLIRVIST